MASKNDHAYLGRPVVLALVLGVWAVIPGAGLSTPVLEAQGRPDLEAQHQRLLPLFEVPGVVFTDADETRGRLVVGISDRGAAGLVRARLRALGIDSQSVDVIETDEIFALATLRDRSNDVMGGLQIHFSGYLCSLGFPAFNTNGMPGFVTASHCSDRQGAVDGTTYYQPLSSVDSEAIGTEVADPPYVRGGATCPKGRKCRWSDANFSLTQGSRAVSVGLIARTFPGSLDIDPAHPFTITGEGVAVQGATVNKVGRTTGWTSGSVSGTCVNTGVSGSTIVLICQTFVTGGGAIVAGGDSGSPVFKIDGGDNVTLLGGLWGGNSSGTQFVYSPIGNIRSELAMIGRTTH